MTVKVLVHNASMFNGATKKIQIFSNFSLIFELHQHDVPQKNTFFKENSDSEEKSLIFK